MSNLHWFVVGAIIHAILGGITVMWWRYKKKQKPPEKLIEYRAKMVAMYGEELYALAEKYVMEPICFFTGFILIWLWIGGAIARLYFQIRIRHLKKKISQVGKKSTIMKQIILTPEQIDLLESQGRCAVLMLSESLIKANQLAKLLVVTSIDKEGKGANLGIVGMDSENVRVESPLIYKEQAFVGEEFYTDINKTFIAYKHSKISPGVPEAFLKEIRDKDWWKEGSELQEKQARLYPFVIGWNIMQVEDIGRDPEMMGLLGCINIENMWNRIGKSEDGHYYEENPLCFIVFLSMNADKGNDDFEEQVL